METFSVLLAICAGNSPVPGELPAQRPVTQSFDVFFDLCLNKRLSKQSWFMSFYCYLRHGMFHIIMISTSETYLTVIVSLKINIR